MACRQFQYLGTIRVAAKKREITDDDRAGFSLKKGSEGGFEVETANLPYNDLPPQRASCSKHVVLRRLEQRTD